MNQFSKIFYLFVFLFLSISIFSPLFSYSQEKTICLKEVIVSHKKKNVAKAAMKTKVRGKQNSYYSLTEDIAFVSEFNIKENHLGILKSVTFFFSNKRSLNPKDTSFELLLFTKGDKGNPEKNMSDSKLLFQVPKDKNGKITIDISSLGVRVKGSFYAGIKRVDKDTQHNFYIDIRQKKGNFIYFRLPKVDDWKIIEHKSIDMEISYFKE